MVNRHSVDNHPSPSGLTSRIHFTIFLQTPQEFIYPQYFLFFLKPIYLTIVGEIFSKLWCSDYWKTHLRVQKLNLNIFTLAPPGKSLPQVLIITPRQGEITHLPREHFFKNQFPASSRKRKGNYCQQLSLVLHEMYPGPTKHVFKQRYVLLNNNHVSIDNENFKYQSMQWSFVIKARQGEVFEVKFDKDLQT